jgi:hypothetical protein
MMLWRLALVDMEVTALRISVRKLVAVGAMLTLLSSSGLAKTKRHTATPSSKTTVHPKPGHSSSKHRRSAKLKRGAWKRHGQQSIQADRVVAIQQALIREKYLEGEPTGRWDDRTQRAMAKYQADNQWQSKVTPDSRALIKLGLGPNHSTEGSLVTGSADSVATTASGTRGTPNR